MEAKVKKPKNPNRVAAGKACGKRSRAKGGDGEREAAKLWRQWFPDCKRLCDQVRKSDNSPDIGCAEMNRHYYVEVKRYKKITDGLLARLYEKMMQDFMVWDGYFGEDYPQPVLMFRQDNQDWYVAVPSASDGEPEYTIQTQYGDAMVLGWPAFAAALDAIHGGANE